MIQLLVALLLLGPARAEAPLAGIPLRDLDDLGLLDPTLLDETDGWRAPVAPGTGWVVHRWAPTAVQAGKDLDFVKSTLQAFLPVVAVAGADEAWGDDGLVLARRGNVFVQVRAAGAPLLAARLLAAVQPEPAAAAQPIEGRDAFGRRRD